MDTCVHATWVLVFRHLRTYSRHEGTNGFHVFQTMSDRLFLVSVGPSVSKSDTLDHLSHSLNSLNGVI